MACLECGLDQAAADAGTCARCGAPLTDRARPSGVITGRHGAELHVDSRGIAVRGKRKARVREWSWDEIRWLHDSSFAPYPGKPGWALHIVLASGDVERAEETRTPGRNRAHRRYWP